MRLKDIARLSTPMKNQHRERVARRTWSVRMRVRVGGTQVPWNVRSTGGKLYGRSLADEMNYSVSANLCG